MKIYRQEEFETPITVARLVKLAVEWNVALDDLYVEESYEMGGSGCVWVIHMV